MFSWSKKVAKIGPKIESVPWSKKEKFDFCTGITSRSLTFGHSSVKKV